jgi:hypothetical protein
MGNARFVWLLVFTACGRAQSTGGASGGAGGGAPPSTSARPLTASAPVAPAEAIAKGTPFWVDSLPARPLINARVDVGTLRRVAPDEVEVVIAWPPAPGTLATLRAAHPSVELPEGTAAFDRERVVCRPEGPLSYRVESRLMGPDGFELAHDVFDAANERAKAEQSDRESAARTRGRHSPHGDNPRSLACLAAASKCRGEPLAWPPPPNKTPLEYSERADAMRAAYNAIFVPRCPS